MVTINGTTGVSKVAEEAGVTYDSEVAYNNDTTSFIANTLTSGAIIERGSNANGEYAKYADGTLICKHGLDGTAYAFSIPSYYTWTFPAAFISNPYNSGFAERPLSDNVSVFVRGGAGVSVTQATFAHSATTSTGTSFRLLAIGRWK